MWIYWDLVNYSFPGIFFFFFATVNNGFINIVDYISSLNSAFSLIIKIGRIGLKGSLFEY